MFTTKKERSAQEEAIRKVVAECRATLVETELEEAQNAQSGDFGFSVLSKIRGAVAIIKTDIGTVEIGLSGFKLIFRVGNGHIDKGSFPREIDPPPLTKVSVQKAMTVKGGSSSKSSRGLELGLQTGADLPTTSLGGHVTSESELSHEQTQSESMTIDKPVVVLTSVSLVQFALSIESPSGDDAWINQKLYDSRLFYVSPVETDRKVTIRPCVQIVPRQFKRGSGTGVFGKKVHKNQEKIIDRLVAKLVDEEWLLPPMESKGGKA